MLLLKQFPFLVFVFTLIILAPITSAQKQLVAEKRAAEALRIKLAQRSAIDNFDVELQRVQFAEVRDNLRYLILNWLWGNGRDGEYAESIALKAMEELIDTDAEEKCSGTCVSILTLIETYAPELKKKLDEKYQLNRSGGFKVIYDELMNKGSTRSVVDKMIGAIGNGEGLESIEAELILDELATQNSPELPRLLEAVLAADERNPVPARTLFALVDSFRNGAVSSAVRTPFYQTVIRKGFAAITSEDEESVASVIQLLHAIAGDVPESDTVQRQQIEYLKTVLKAKDKRAQHDNEEVYARIEKATDKLAATITEAEAASGRNLKETLYTLAVNLAIKARKYKMALELIDKLIESRKSRDKDGSYNKRFEIAYDQFYRDIALAALKDKDLETSDIATQRIVRDFTRAEVLRQAALILFDDKRPDTASVKLRQAFKIVSEAEHSRTKIYMLLRQIPAFQKVDKVYLLNVTHAAAKTIDAFPALDERLSPDSDEYKSYIDSILYSTGTLLAAFDFLLKNNRLEANDLASRITKKEFKVVVEYALMMDKLKALRKAQVKPVAVN